MQVCYILLFYIFLLCVCLFLFHPICLLQLLYLFLLRVLRLQFLCLVLLLRSFASIISIHTSALSIASIVLIILYLSMLSFILFFLLIPAVSIRIYFPFSFSTLLSTASLVVPAILLTMLLFSPQDFIY